MPHSENETPPQQTRGIPQLQFEVLPDYARFLLEHKLEEFSRAGLAIFRQIHIPLFRHLKGLEDAELEKLIQESNLRFLRAIAENTTGKYLEETVATWKANQLPLLRKENIASGDITSISYARRKAFRDFLPLFTGQTGLMIRIMDEMDRLTTAIEQRSFDTIAQMQEESIQEQDFFIHKVNNAIPGFIYVYDLVNQKEVYSNQKIGEMLGYPREEVSAIDTNLMDQLVHPEDLSRVISFRKDFAGAADGEIRTIEYRVCRKGGLYTWLRRYDMVFHRDAGAIPTQIIGVAMDISQEKQAIRRLEFSEQQLKEAQEIAELGSFVWDLKDGNSEYSPKLMDIFGLEVKSDMATFLEYVHPTDRKKVRDAIEKAMKGDGIYDCEYRYRKNGNEKIIWSRGIVSFRKGEATQMRGTVMDVTQRHDMLRSLERSEELHKQAQALTHIGNWNWSPGNDKVYWSDEMYRIFGLEPQSETITMDRFHSFLEPVSRPARMDLIRSSLQTHVVEDDILRIWLEDGTRKVVSAKGKVLIDEAGKPYKITGTCQDITQEFLLNEKLKKSEATFRQVISNAPDAVIVIDDNGRIAIWNPVAEKIFGWKESEVVGRPLDQIIIPPGYRNLHLEDLERQRSGEAPHILGKTMEVSAINKKGEEFYIALSISRSDGPDNNSYISFIRDISREKQAEIELELKGSQLLQKNIELERSNQELLSFNYIASHDLQEPIRKIKIFSSRIMEKSQGKLPEGVVEIVQQVSANADYMQKLLDALLSYSRITTEGQVAEILDPNQVLEEVTQTLKDLIEEKKAVIIAEQLPKVRFVPVQFFQLVENLISNSLKYSKADTPPRILFHSISIPDREMPAFEGMVHGKDYHLISVTDNGIGFDQQFSEKVFELFQRLHGRNEYAGTGVGLAICRKIVQNHGGFITADSRPGEGTTMKIYLPVVQA